jgi:hypothetical protein
MSTMQWMQKPGTHLGLLSAPSVGQGRERKIHAGTSSMVVCRKRVWGTGRLLSEMNKTTQLPTSPHVLLFFSILHLLALFFLMFLYIGRLPLFVCGPSVSFTLSLIAILALLLTV